MRMAAALVILSALMTLGAQAQVRSSPPPGYRSVSAKGKVVVVAGQKDAQCAATMRQRLGPTVTVLDLHSPHEVLILDPERKDGRPNARMRFNQSFQGAAFFSAPKKPDVVEHMADCRQILESAVTYFK
jgi:hypothetical protein